MRLPESFLPHVSTRFKKLLTHIGRPIGRVYTDAAIRLTPAGRAAKTWFGMEYLLANTVPKEPRGLIRLIDKLQGGRRAKAYQDALKALEYAAGQTNANVRAARRQLGIGLAGLGAIGGGAVAARKLARMRALKRAAARRAAVRRALAAILAAGGLGYTTARYRRKKRA